MKTYIIPDNYIDDSRIFRGLFRTRYFIEGAVLAALGLPLALWAGGAAGPGRLTAAVCVCAPLFLLGIAGIRGKPVSRAVRDFMGWVMHRSILLYDRRRRSLAAPPAMTMMNTPGRREKMMEKWERWKEKQAEKRQNRPLVEGENFRFSEDPDRMRRYADPEADRLFARLVFRPLEEKKEEEGEEEHE